MLCSVRWLNRLLSPADLTPDEAEHALTHAGFPVESRETLPDGDTRLDVELTSNRGDCLCHLGLAREVAAATGRRLVHPDEPSARAAPEGPARAASLASVENRLSATGGCPRFTARVVRGVKVGPSPAWLAAALESVGQRSINNVVDVSNFVLFELGHPSHTFDLAALKGARLIIRDAADGEPLTALDGRRHTLRAGEMVVADAERAVSLAGIIGGLDTAVTERTAAVLLEMATWDPVLVRRAARRLDIRTDASHRFERFVDPRDIDAASLRAARLIVEVAGGELVEGVLDDGLPPAPRAVVTLRSERCRALLGVDVPTIDMVRLLTSIGAEVSVERHGQEERLRCVVPHHRHDLTREIDLVEEVARLRGFDRITVAPSLDVHLEMNHPTRWAARERAMQALSDTLAGAGFFETVTFSFAARAEAEAFMPPGLRAVMVDEDRRKEAPFLRPSIVPSLLTCLRANHDARVRAPRGVRLFETASVFAEQDDGERFARATVENRNLALLIDAPADTPAAEAPQTLLRTLRGVIEAAAQALAGPAVEVRFEPCDPPFPALRGETCAGVLINGGHAGYTATITAAARRDWGVETAVAVSELSLDALIALYPPRATVTLLPRFPAIERDLSVVVQERVRWADIHAAVVSIRPALLEAVDFVGVFRGRQIGQGRKSVTLRMTFRHPDRTLRHEEVDPQVEAVVAALAASVGGELRGPAAS